MAVALAAGLVACESPSDYESLDGTWRLDAETQEWVPRACVILDFDPAREALFEVEQPGDEFRVRLNDRRGTTFHGTVRGGLFDGRQFLPTSPTGSVCGSTTPVHMRLNLRGQMPGTLTGTWRTPACPECPDRRFGAVRAEP